MNVVKCKYDNPAFVMIIFILEKFLPSLLSVIILPYTTILVAKSLMKIESPKLIYKHQFTNIFLSTLIADILGSLFPYGGLLIFVGLFAFLSKRELKISFMKALGLALAGALLILFFRIVILYLFWQIILTALSRGI